ncbi:uncharacterized protein LOC120270158 [Dioscorea cayenensis subsp. rotundata]|uniref:Uncharacterized protein LOC120270158 n=1 Tax=Dioscorea cayennensis subsp. rotundata TaxID=55577 RepID=A0AB40C050_DIOCR|nr:uncharacterized protein LOC120270158 [Dioscorea cayenensis subsp. rotundata]
MVTMQEERSALDDVPGLEDSSGGVSLEFTNGVLWRKPSEREAPVSMRYRLEHRGRWRSMVTVCLRRPAMSFKYISQLKPPGQNQIVKIRVTRIWDCYVPTSNRFFGIAFLATDSQVLRDSFIDIYSYLEALIGLTQIIMHIHCNLQWTHNY